MRARINKSKSPSAGKKPAGGFPIKKKSASPLKFMSFDQQAKQQVAQREQLSKLATTQPVLNGANYDRRNTNYSLQANNYNTNQAPKTNYENPNTNQTPLMSKKQRK
jgi:hypothetical protein